MEGICFQHFTNPFPIPPPPKKKYDSDSRVKVLASRKCHNLTAHRLCKNMSNSNLPTASTKSVPFSSPYNTDESLELLLAKDKNSDNYFNISATFNNIYLYYEMSV